MKTLDLQISKTIGLVLVLALFSLGCAEESTSRGQGASQADDGSIPDPGSTGGGDGALDLVGDSLAEKMQKFGQFTRVPMNNATDLKVTLNLTKTSGTATDKSFGGYVVVSYTDNGQEQSLGFHTGESADDTQYNQWVDIDNQRVFHGVFGDHRYTGIAIVIDRVIDLGDGSEPGDVVGGSIWYKRLGEGTLANHSYAHCWFVYYGPYDCRPWAQDNGMNITQSVNPGNGYVLLGNFDGMSINKAFNGESVLN